MRPSFACTALLTFVVGATLVGQQAGPNFNVTVFTTDPRTGDAYLQRQVEPTIAVSPLNPDVIMAAANDYRLISQPDDQGVGEGNTLETLAAWRVGSGNRPLLAAQTVRDTWIGLYFSTDRGVSWMNMLHPGHPFDSSPLGRSLPIYGHAAATDPVLTAYGRYFFLTALFFDRGGNSRLTVSRFRNRNDESAHPVLFEQLGVIDRGSQTSGGYFVDKPHIAVDMFRPGMTRSECNVYVAFTVFNGTNQSHLRVSRSLDCGVTWSTPKNVANPGIRNQGANIAVDKRTGHVYVVWRSFSPNQILFARSTDGGATWSAPASLTPGEQLCAYDQPTCPLDSGKCGGSSGDLARSLGLPSATVDAAGRVHVVWQERVTADGRRMSGAVCLANAAAAARIVRAVSVDGGLTWSAGVAIDHGARCEVADGTHGPRERACNGPADPAARPAGAQTKPSITSSGDRLVVVYKEARGLVDPMTGYPLGRDRQYDLRAAYLDPATGQLLGSTQVSRYQVDFEGRIVTGPDGAPDVSRDNVPMYKGGTAAFAGDYEHVVPTLPFVPGPSGWRWAGPLDVPTPSFLAAWYDTRDVVFPRDGTGSHSLNGAWTAYDPPGSGIGTCNPGSRDSNIYMAQIDSGLVVSARQNFRAFGQEVEQVSYAITVRNTTRQARSYELRLREAPGVQASFAQSMDLDELTRANRRAKRIFAGSEMVFTVFAIGPNPSPAAAIVVEVDDIATQRSPDALLTLNPDPGNDAIHDASTTSRETHRGSIAMPTVFTRTVQKPGLMNPDFGNPDFGNPDFGNPDFGNPDFGNATFGETGYTDYTDVNFVVTNTDGNVTSAYTPFVLFAEREALLRSHRLQVIVSRTVASGAAGDCDALLKRRSQVLSSAIATKQAPDFGNPDFGNPDFGNPDFGNPAFGNPDFGNPDFGNPDFGNFSFVLAPDDAAGTSHQPDGPVHSPRAVERINITIRAWHCRVAGQCGEGVEAEDPSHELFPQTPQSVGGAITLLVVPQARDNMQGTLLPHPALAAFGPDLAVEGKPTLGQTTYAPGAAIHVPEWIEANRGTADATRRAHAYYLSPDNALSGDDVRLARVETQTRLSAGTSRIVSGDRTVVPPGTTPGDYYLLLVVDDGNGVAETDEGNNVLAVPLRVLQFALTFQQQPSDANPGEAIAPPVRLVVLDQNGERVSNVAVTVAAHAGGTAVPLGGVTSVATDAAGVAQFPGLTIADERTGVQLVASAGSPSVESNTFNVGSISFEVYPDDPALAGRRAQPTCAECPVSTEFASRGLVLSFTRDASIDGGVQTAARLLETTQLADEGTAPNHSVTAPRLLPTSGAHATGVLRLMLAGRPRQVSLRVRGPDVQDDQVVAIGLTGDNRQVSATQVSSTYASACCGAQRQATLTFTDQGTGIVEVQIVVTVDGGGGRGGAIYVDNVRVVP